MRKLALTLLVIATGTLAAAGRIAVWLDVPGSAAYQLVESARIGFEEGLEEAGLNPVPREEVTSINTVIDPKSDAQLALLATALGCDYVASLTVTTDGDGVKILGLVYDPYAGKRHESTALAESADGARKTARHLAEELTRALPTAGPLISLDERWMTAQTALGDGDGVRFNDYLWIYRYDEPLVHPDTGEILGVNVMVIGVGRVEDVRGDHLSLVSLSPPAAGLGYEPSDRVRMLDEEDYERLGLTRGMVVPFGVFGFGETEAAPVPLPRPPIHPPRPEGIELKLEESLELDYSPVGLDASFEGVVLCGDDERLYLLPMKLGSDAERIVETGGSGPVARLGGDVYLADSWEGAILKVETETGEVSRFTDEISPELLIRGGDGYLWAVVFSYSDGYLLTTYPALRISPGGDVVEVRELEAGKLNDFAVAPDGTLYYLTSFEPVRGQRPDGVIVEVGARMLPDPKALDTDHLGWLYVLDAKMGLVVFDSDQRIMGTWSGAGVVDLSNVDLIAVAENDVYLASNWDQALYRLSFTYVY
ncbi:hypothetical protein KAU45_00530 [bacterium]|nr:hypothetical protein [bacterium]